MSKIISGFSRFSKKQKIDWLIEHYLSNNAQAKDILTQYWNKKEKLQKLHDEFSENTLTNFYMPFGIAPNFKVNDRILALPMVIEESSVVAAASKAAKFWLHRGGFKTTVLGKTKVGHVHFTFEGDKNTFSLFFRQKLEKMFFKDTESITHKMRQRGGGITAIELVDKTADIPHYFQLKVTFDSVDAMGANFINSCLEQQAKTLERMLNLSVEFSSEEKNSLQIIMCIVSNYTPESMVRAEVSCPVEQLADNRAASKEFAVKFAQAIHIAEIEPYRATTHNKGIMNGVDALVIATGNDFRAVEACAHTYAARKGTYSSLTHCEIKDSIFRFWIDLPLALGTVGGLTSLHPLVKLSLAILEQPNAKELMEMVAVAGLAQNFGAVGSLVTSGIQKGHMKMHLLNILNQLEATDKEKTYFIHFFKDKTVSHHLVAKELKRLRAEKKS